jgi:teichuronic acid exporter
LALISGLFGTVLYPSLKKLKAEGGDVNGEYMFILKVIGLLVFPISAALLLFPNLLVSILWGPHWSAVAPYLPYFGILIFTQPLLSTIGTFLVLQGKDRTLMYSGWITSAFIVASIIYGASFSMMGMVQAYSLCFLIIVLPYNIVFVYYQKLDFPASVLFKFWFPVLSLSLAIWLACFFNIPTAKYAALALLFIALAASSSKEIKGAIRKGRGMLKSRRETKSHLHQMQSPASAPSTSHL